MSGRNKQATSLPWSAAVGRKLRSIRDTGSWENPVERLQLAAPLIKCYSFEYLTDDERHEGKATLLACWRHLLQNLDSTPYEDRALALTCLFHLLRRSEWSVAHLDFDKALRPRCPNWEVSLAIEYRSLLCETVEYVTRKLVKTSIYPSLLHFAARVLAVAYFCIPNLFGLIVDTLISRNVAVASAEQMPQVMEEIRILINHDKMMAHELAKASGRDGPPLPTDLIQNVYLFRGLSTAVGYIHEPAEDAPWLQLIAERGELFCLFFKELVLHIRSVFRRSLRTVVIPWCVIPGYSSLLQALLFEMKQRTPLQCADFLVDTTRHQLANPYVLSLLISVTLTNTNVHQVSEVACALDRISLWLRGFHKKHSRQTAANTFDPSVLFESLSILFDSQHYAVLCKGIQWCYYNIDYIRGKYRVHLVSDILLKRFFFKLFLHWHVGVRRFFHRLLVYKLVSFQTLSTWRRFDFENPELILQPTEIRDHDDAFDMVICSKVDTYMKMMYDQVAAAQAKKAAALARDGPAAHRPAAERPLRRRTPSVRLHPENALSLASASNDDDDDDDDDGGGGGGGGGEGGSGGAASSVGSDSSLLAPPDANGGVGTSASGGGAGADSGSTGGDSGAGPSEGGGRPRSGSRRVPLMTNPTDEVVDETMLLFPRDLEAYYDRSVEEYRQVVDQCAEWTVATVEALSNPRNGTTSVRFPELPFNVAPAVRGDF